MKLTNEALTKVRQNQRLRNLIALDQDCHSATVDRWLSSNNDNLTKASVLNIIENGTGLTREQIIDDSNSVPA